MLRRIWSVLAVVRPTRCSAAALNVGTGHITLAGSSAAISSTLEPLAAQLAPHKVVVECGSGGTCGPNSLGCVLAHARIYQGSGDDVRRRVVAHATKLVRTRAEWAPAMGEIEETSVRELIEDSFASWAEPLGTTMKRKMSSMQVVMLPSCRREDSEGQDALR